ncbi:MAG: Ig-like domain-containing protein [Verrucomicrobiota bacterium]
MLSTILSISPSIRAEVVDVDVNLNIRHDVGGIDQFDREKYIQIHDGAAFDENWDLNAPGTQFLEEYDVYVGRNMGAFPYNLSQIAEDPNNPGWVDPTSVAAIGTTRKANYAKDTARHALEHRANIVFGGQMPMYPNGQINGDGWALADYDAFADYISRIFTESFGTGGLTGEPKPQILEVLNEPFVKATQYGTTRANISELHRVVALKMKTDHPDVLVGGYSAAHPEYEGNNFVHWENNWKTFIDIAGEHMDYFSLHLYDNYQGSSETFYYEPIYRSGSNIEAILDMVEQYSFIALSEVKPFNITEYGALPYSGDHPYAKTHDWPHLAAFNKIMMQLLERPDRIMQAIPFIVLSAEWGRNQVSGNPYGPRLIRQQFEVPGETGNAWVFTEFVKFYEMWRGVNGTRVETYATDPDLQVDAYVDGNEVYVILNSLDHMGIQTVDLNLFGTRANRIQSIDVKHLYANAIGEPIIDQTTVDTVTEVTLQPSATMILKYTFDGAILQNQTCSESKYYATTYLAPITADTPIVVNINDVTTTTLDGEVVLRVGMGRDHGSSLQPTILFNGTPVEVPLDWRGADQSTRNQFFGVLEIPVPYESLQTNNSVSIQFPDTGGHISSVSIQVFEFSAPIERTLEPALPITTFEFSPPNNLQLGVADGLPDGYFAIETTNNLNAPWTLHSEGLDLDAQGNGSTQISVSDNRWFLRVRESGPAPIPTTGFSIFPNSDIVGVGGFHHPLPQFLPITATNKNLQWVSSDPSVASVAPNGWVVGLEAGSTTITATTQDGGFNGSYTLTVGSSTPSINFDSRNNYTNQVFHPGGQLTVRCQYDAGEGFSVTDTAGGIKYFLREVRSDWSVANDYVVDDPSVIGTQAGASTATIPLPLDLPLTADLPDGNFYFLFILFHNDDPMATSTVNIGVRPIIIADPEV